MSVLEVGLAAKARPSASGRLLPLRDVITLLLVLAASISVVDAIESGEWVEGMPSLYPVALFGIAGGYLLARLPWREVFIHPLGLLAGAAGLLIQVLAITPGDDLKGRCGEMVLRMRLWFDALVSGGISSDGFPIIVLILVATWFATYALAWSAFRWRNPLPGLVPGGLALLVNISYLPGQTSPNFVAFVVAAALLMSRAHFDGKMGEWRRAGTSYPGSLHFFSLNQTVWATLVLVGAAWLIPVAGESGPLQSIWRASTDPLAERFVELGRVFTAVEAKKGMPFERYATFLPYRGYFAGVDGPIMSVKSAQPVLLRAAVYDVYTSSGWKIGERDSESLDGRSQDLAGLLDEAEGERREPAAVEVVVEQPLPVFVVPGEPLAVSRGADVEFGADRSDVISLRPSEGLEPGDTYSAIGLVSVATMLELHASPAEYPDWVAERYLKLPNSLSPSICNLAEELTGEFETSESSAYEKAVLIEDYLRSFPLEANEQAPPSSWDAVSYFLFNRQRGHPLYHASAMVVLLRAVGVPARLAVGFALSEDGGEDGVYEVGGKDAYAWPEVYFAGYGWIPFTPSSKFDAASAPSEGFNSYPADTLSKEEVLRMLPPAAEDAPNGEEAQPAAPAIKEEAGGGFPLWVAGSFGVAVALLMALGGGLYFAWNRGMSGLSRPAEVLEKTRRLASWARIGTSAAQTPREFTRSLREELSQAPDVGRLASAYERVEFGRKELTSDDEADLDALWKRLRPRLVGRIVRRWIRVGGRQ